MRLLAVLSIFALLHRDCGDPPEDENTPAGGGGAGGIKGTLYVPVGTSGQTFKLDLAGGTFKQLGLAPEPTVTPDGKIIASDGDLFESDETLAAHRVIGKFNSDPEKANDGYHAPQVDKEGKRIVYVTNDTNLYVVDRASGAVLNRIEGGGILDGYERPTWTPDGRIVASGYLKEGLFISDAAITTMTRFDPGLARPREPAVSPDGTKVAFVLNNRVNVINIDGTGLTPVVTADEEDHYPTWSPDGTHIAYRISGRILIIPATGGTGIDLFEAGFKEIGDKYFIFSGYQFAWR